MGKNLFLAVIAAALVAGCATSPRSKYHLSDVRLKVDSDGEALTVQHPYSTGLHDVRLKVLVATGGEVLSYKFNLPSWDPDVPLLADVHFGYGIEGAEVRGSAEEGQILSGWNKLAHSR